MQDRRQLDRSGTLMMMMLCAIWGMQTVAMKLAAPEVTPVLQIALRSGVSALVIYGLGHMAGAQPWLRRGVMGPGVTVGTLFALEFLLVAEGLRWTTASHMSVFLYTAPIFASIGLHWKLPQERLDRAQWIGIGVGFVGIALAFTGSTPPGHAAAAPNMLLGDLMGLLGGVAWGLTTVVVRTTPLSEAPATQTLCLQLVGAFVWLLVAAFALGETHFAPGPMAWSVMGFQTFVVAIFSYLVWFRMLRKYLASRLGVFTFLSPLFGVAFAWGLLHDPLTPNFLIGALLVLAGVVIVNEHQRLRQWIRVRVLRRA